MSYHRRLSLVLLWWNRVRITPTPQVRGSYHAPTSNFWSRSKSGRVGTNEFVGTILGVSFGQHWFCPFLDHWKQAQTYRARIEVRPSKYFNEDVNPGIWARSVSSIGGPQGSQTTTCLLKSTLRPYKSLSYKISSWLSRPNSDCSERRLWGLMPHWSAELASKQVRIPSAAT